MASCRPLGLLTPLTTLTRMPVHYSHEDGVTFVVASGTSTVEEMRAQGVAAVAAATEASPARVLLDMSQSQSVAERATRELEESARLFAERASVVRKVAIVAPQDLVYGLMRMAAAFSEGGGLNAQAFRDKSEAEAWLHEDS